MVQETKWNTTSISDARLNEQTMFWGTTDPTSGLPTNALYLNTTTNTLKQNTGTEGSPTWTVRIGGLWEPIDDYEASSAEATKTFSFTGVTMDDHSKIVVVYDGSTSASMTLNFRINQITSSSYHTDGTSTIGGTTTSLDLGASTSGQLWGTGQLTAANNLFQGTIDVYLTKGSGGSGDLPFSSHNGVGNGTQRNVSIRLISDQTSITDVTIFGSQNWNIGTRITVYKVKRTL